VPQTVPLATSPVDTQIACPELHDVIPVWQGLLGMHAIPAVHEPQIPLVQTSFVPHAVPLATSPVETQVECPVLHDVTPNWQGLLGVHMTPAAHETQLPLEHTSFVPQSVPLGTSPPVATQIECPVLQDVLPVRHTSPAGVQATPALHDAGGSGRARVRGAAALPTDSESSVAKSQADVSAASPPQTTKSIYLRCIMTFDPPRRPGDDPIRWLTEASSTPEWNALLGTAVSTRRPYRTSNPLNVIHRGDTALSLEADLDRDSDEEFGPTFGRMRVGQGR
jgi:hypothetical protein